MTDEQTGTRSAVQTSWSWTSLRRINSLLANSKNCEDAKVRAKYEGLARFFRAYFYFIKVKKWGDVPWVDRELESDDEALYAPRDTREKVVDEMIKDLDIAIENSSRARSASTTTPPVPMRRAPSSTAVPWKEPSSSTSTTPTTIWTLPRKPPRK